MNWKTISLRCFSHLICRFNTISIKIFTDIYDNEEGELKIIAASNLGYMYLNGLGSLTDIPKAKRYLKYASDYSYQPAIEMLNNIK